MNALSRRSLLRQTYIKSMDKDFVAATIQAIGRCATNIGEVRDTCLNGLVQLLSNRDGESLPFSSSLFLSAVNSEGSQKTQGFCASFSRGGFLSFPSLLVHSESIGSVFQKRTEKKSGRDGVCLMEADKSEAKRLIKSEL